MRWGRAGSGATGWGERAVAILLDRLIWITAAGGERARVRCFSSMAESV